jgi:hypothetical protein
MSLARCIRPAAVGSQCAGVEPYDPGNDHFIHLAPFPNSGGVRQGKRIARRMHGLRYMRGKQVRASAAGAPGLVFSAGAPATSPGVTGTATGGPVILTINDTAGSMVNVAYCTQGRNFDCPYCGAHIGSELGGIFSYGATRPAAANAVQALKCNQSPSTVKSQSVQLYWAGRESMLHGDCGARY